MGDAEPNQGHGNDYRDRKGDNHCHCQGGRLLVLFGPLGYKEGRTGKLVEAATGDYIPEDQAMFNAQNWALGFYAAQRKANKHIHMLRYNANRSGAPNAVNTPEVPAKKATPPETLALGGGEHQDMPGRDWSWQSAPRKKLTDTLAKCCCFLTEVLLICHGGQGADVSFILDNLSKVIGGRPVEKFVFWSCRSGKLFMPGDEAYKKLCGLFRPRMCECGCTAGACTAFDPNGKQRHCPDGTKPTKIVTSGQYNGKPTPVGLKPSTNPPAKSPFTSPDGEVRTITIAPNGAGPVGDQATATVGPPGGSLFGGAGLSTAPPVPAPPPNAAGAAKEKTKMQKPSEVAGKDTPYTGPVANLKECQPSEGCIPGANASASE
jgi:hypothetical protein